MKTAVLDRATLGDDLNITLPQGFEAEVYDSTSPSEVLERIRNAEAVFVNKVRLDESNLSKAGSLKIICEAATGYDNIDVEYCKKRGIAVCNVPGYSVYSVAQVTVSAVLYLVNHLGEYTRFVRSGEYTKSGIQNRLEPVFNELYGKTWGIVGYGAIGSKVADSARALGCKVLAFKRTASKGVECTDLDTLMAQSDIITVHLPLSEQTHGIIDERRISLMKKNAVFVNSARGAVADEAALCRAVESGAIAALGADVYSREPFSQDSPYWRIKDFDNVCLTPPHGMGSQGGKGALF